MINNEEDLKNIEDALCDNERSGKTFGIEMMCGKIKMENGSTLTIRKRIQADPIRDLRKPLGFYPANAEVSDGFSRSE